MRYGTKWGWVRIPIAGFLGELVLIAAVVPFFIVLGEEGAQAPLQYAVPPLCLIILVPSAWWAARRAQSGHLPIGALVGLVAVGLYVIPILVAGREITLAYHLGNALKVIGGVIGGFIAAKPGTTRDAAKG